MRRMTVAVAGTALLLTACAGHTPINSPKGDGGKWFTVSCPWGSDACREEASEACPGGYEIDQTHAKAGKPRDFSAWHSSLIRCKGYGDGEPSAPKEASPAPAKDDEWKQVKAGRWSVRVPSTWSASGTGAKRTLEDPKGKNEATIETLKWADTLDAFAADRFKGWHGSKPVKLAKRDAVRGEDTDGTNQTTAVALVVDGIAYLVTCVDVDAGTTSETCTRLLRSFRVEEAG